MLNRNDNKRVKTIKNGNHKGLIELRCLDCCGFDRKEAKCCNDKKCSLWLFRPRFKPTEQQKQQWIKDVPIHYSNMVKFSRRTCVHNFCWECCGKDTNEVNKCQNIGCVLWILRPNFKPTEQQRIDWEQSCIKHYLNNPYQQVEDDEDDDDFEQQNED